MTEVKTCSTCANWRLKESQLARAGFASCSIGKHYTHVAAIYTCASHKPAAPEIVAARLAWLDKKQTKKAT
jgi:hypothetical protein